MSSKSIDIANGLNFLHNANANGTNGSVYVNLTPFGQLNVYNTNNSPSNVDYGGLNVNGGFGINNATDISSLTQGGAFTVAGGMSIAGDTYIAQNMYIGNNSNTTGLVTVNTVTNGNFFTGTWTNTAGTLKSFTITTPSGGNDTGLNPIVFNNPNALAFIVDETANVINSGSRLFIDGLYGNVNINTTTPLNENSPLFLSGTGSETGIHLRNTVSTNSSLRLQVPRVGSVIITNGIQYSSILTNDAGPVQIGTGVNGTSASRIYFNTTGNIGINNTSPNFSLDVTGIANFATSVTTSTVSAINSTITNILSIATSLSNTYTLNTSIGTLLMTSGSVTMSSLNVSSIGITSTNLNFTGNLYSNGSLFTGASPWIIYPSSTIYYNNGYTGIGTTAPNFTLDVSGGARLQSSTTIGSLFITNGNVLVANNINSYGNMVQNTGNSFSITTNFETFNNRLRTSRANANTAVSTWYTRASAADNSWNDVCWSSELSLFVAVAGLGTGRVMTSPNGITWTTRTTPGNTWQSVCWSPELSFFVAVADLGSGERVMTSNNGITWTTQANIPSNEWQSVCWSPELSLFVAVAGSGTGTRVMTSNNGITWTTRASAADHDWNDVCWSSELSLFVAVAGTGTGNRVMTSNNGITWTTRASAANNTWYGVCWSPELSIFVAIATSGTGTRVMTSNNGITWTTRTSAADNTWNGGVCWSPELSIFVAVATSGIGNRVMTSQIALPNSKSTLLVSPAHLTYNPSGTSGSISITGALSKGSGTFDIPHPLVAGKRLVHSFIEGPRCDLIYRGEIQLSSGRAVVNIEHDSVANEESIMTPGTFIALCDNPVYYLQNASSFNSLRGEINENLLTIICENESSCDTVHWCVMAERKDDVVKAWDRTDNNGYLITEHTNS